MTKTKRQWILAKRPQGKAQLDDFRYQEVPFTPPALKDGELLVRTVAFLCAPTIRNWMDPPSINLYPSINIDEPIMGPLAARVVQSKNPSFPEGALVTSAGTWEDYIVVDEQSPLLRRMPEGCTPVDALGLYGLNALTGYFGLTRIGQPQKGDVILVSGAAGSAGSSAAQVGKTLGCKVIGIAGGAEKCKWLTEECGIDACIDYKAESVTERLAELCPEGINVFFDNVGGDILQAGVNNLAPGARVALCGQIATYDEDDNTSGLKNIMRLIYGSMRMEGFLVNNYEADFPDACELLEKWAKEGKFEHREDVRKGFESLPSSFLNLFEGKNSGTLIVQTGD